MEKMNNNPAVSVVMSVYNAELYLEDAIESILNQTYKDFEFIIINDGSTDSSLEIIKKYSKKDERIIVVSRDNKGIVYSLNEGIRLAKGEYIARMDADDISLDFRFEQQLNFIKKNSLDICGGSYLLINEVGNIRGLNIVTSSHIFCTLSMMFGVPFAHPSVLISKKFLVDNNLEYGQSSYKRAEDYDLWVRMHKAGAFFGNVNEVVLKYRITKNSLSIQNRNKIISESRKIRLDFAKKLHFKRFFQITKDDSMLLNYEEETLIVRYLFNNFFKRRKLVDFSCILNINIKIILKIIISELKNR